MEMLCVHLSIFFLQDQNAEYVQLPEDHVTSITVNGLADVYIQRHILQNAVLKGTAKHKVLIP